MNSHQIPWARPRPQHRFSTVKGADGGDGNCDVSGFCYVTTEQAHSGRLTFLTKTVSKIEYPTQRQISGG
jgi:hypothetical protein